MAGHVDGPGQPLRAGLGQAVSQRPGDLQRVGEVAQPGLGDPHPDLGLVCQLGLYLGGQGAVPLPLYLRPGDDDQPHLGPSGGAEGGADGAAGGLGQGGEGEGQEAGQEAGQQVHGEGLRSVRLLPVTGGDTFYQQTYGTANTRRGGLM